MCHLLYSSVIFVLATWCTLCYSFFCTRITSILTYSVSKFIIHNELVRMTISVCATSNRKLLGNLGMYCGASTSQLCTLQINWSHINRETRIPQRTASYVSTAKNVISEVSCFIDYTVQFSRRDYEQSIITIM